MRLNGFCLIPVLAVVCSLTQVNAACPSYTHKDDAVEGATANLPDGWFVYVQSGKKGLHKSDIKNFKDSIIPGTENDSASFIDISDDGKWITYWSNGKITLVKPDGSVRKQIAPVYSGPTLAPFGAGFYHNGPAGTEVFYSEFDWNRPNPAPAHDTSELSIVWAMKVDLSGAAPAAGTVRKLAQLSRTKAESGTGVRFNPFEGQTLVCKDQIFGLINYGGGYRNGFITVPDSGNGTAGPGDLYQFIEGNSTVNYYGCGEAMSRDGAYCASNSNAIGDSCVPNTKSDPAMDHKGFYVTKFMRLGDPKIAIDDQIDNEQYGRSINWCPVEYRTGDYQEVDFNNWRFSNKNEYVIGSLKGSKAAVKGIWAVRWNGANVWTLVTPDQATVTYDYPAVFFTGAVGVKENIRPARMNGASGRTIDMLYVRDSHKSVALGPSITGFKVFSLAGELLWHYHRANGVKTEKVILPQALTKNQALVLRFEH